MWILPSYNRPDQCREVIEQMKKMGCSTRGVLLVNGGDSKPYENIELPEGWTGLYLLRNLGVCGAMNKLYELYPDEPWYGLICDDEFPLTENWDTQLVEAAGDWKIAHGNDGWQSQERIHGIVVLGGKLVRELGWMALPGLWHWFVDNTWELIAGYCGTRVLVKDAFMEHRHWRAGKAAKDEVHELGESRALEDRAIFVRWATGDARIVLNKLKDKMNGS
jgi:glycosyltransferase involved in cell wall biosynthesis